MIPFNKPYLSGKELDFIETAHFSHQLAGDGAWTKFSNDKYNELNELLNRKQPKLEIPTIQILSNNISILAIIILLIYIILVFSTKLKHYMNIKYKI